MRIIKGDLTSLDRGYILQQCNCVSLQTKGLSETLRNKFPNTCPYDLRRPDPVKNNFCIKEDISKPGTIFILGNEDDINVINLFGQYFPGKPKKYFDTYEQRKNYFQSGLEGIIDFFDGSQEYIEISVPYRIGCGLAGGYWPD